MHCIEQPVAGVYRYFSHGELVGHSGPELPPHPESTPVTPRMYVFVPGPAFPRVWPAMLALQRAGATTAQTLLAAHADGRLLAFRPGATAVEIRANLIELQLPRAGGEAAAVTALALELHDETGPLVNARGVMVIEYPSDAMVAFSPEVRAEIERAAPSLGFPADPPYYTLAVPPHL